MGDPNRFYVYVMFRPWNGEPCYIGKGQGKRAQVLYRGHNPHLARIIAKAGAPIPTVILQGGLAEDEAFMVERAFIAALGRGKNGPLVNLTDGGEGRSGTKHSAATIKLMSEIRRDFMASLTPEERSAIARKGAASLTEEFKIERCAKAKAALTTEQRVVFGKQAAAGFTQEERRERAIRASHSISPEQRRINGIKGQSIFSPEERSQRSVRASAKACPEKRRANGQAWMASRTSEQRTYAAQMANASRSLESRITGGHKAWATRTAKGECEFPWVEKSRWINNGERTMRLKLGTELPVGWVYGRRLTRE